MISSNGPRTAKISRDVSNFIVTQVLERSDDLIKNSYRRLTTENVARNEHWAKIAEKVSEKFEIPAEMERVKSHFHNRKKVLLSRIKDELKNVTNVSMMSTDEKIEELVRRKICVGEYEEQLARVCLDIDEEEKGRSDSQFGTDQIIPPIGHLFTETSQQSLLSQLLNSAQSAAIERPLPIPSPLQSSSSRDSDPQIVTYVPSLTVNTSRAPLLSKLLSDPSTSKDALKSEEMRKTRASSGARTLSAGNSDRKRRAVSPLDRHHRSPVLPNLNGSYLSHLIVDVTSPQELKRLLGLLIDHGFSRFQHVGSSEMVSTSNPAALRNVSRSRISETPVQEPIVDDSLMERDDESLFWSSANPPNDDETHSPENQIDVVKEIQSRVERVEVKVEPCHEDQEMEDEEVDEVDEQTAELEAELATEALKNGLALFGKSQSTPKKAKTGSAASSVNGEVVFACCELCGSIIRLNAGGSKWNFYEHVMMKHSAHKPYKCSQCPYQAGRKVRVRQHALSQHQVETDPVDMSTPEIRSEWLKTMSECFPHHQYGKSTIATRSQ